MGFSEETVATLEFGIEVRQRKCISKQTQDPGDSLLSLEAEETNQAPLSLNDPLS
jgi:hypothetical protein